MHERVLMLLCDYCEKCTVTHDDDE